MVQEKYILALAMALAARRGLLSQAQDSLLGCFPRHLGMRPTRFEDL